MPLNSQATKTFILCALLPFLLAFARPVPIDNSIQHLLSLLAQHEELRPCLDWLSDNDVRFITYTRWAAVYRGNIILTPPVVNRGPATAAIIVGEISHLQGWLHPESDYIQRRAARILKVEVTGQEMAPCVPP